MVKIFLTGATGYIGGEVLHTLVKVHPEYQITCLVRSSEKAKLIEEAFSDVYSVVGDLSDENLLKMEVSKADITIHTASSGHLQSAQAIVSGIESGYLIHNGGTSVLCFEDIANSTYGDASETIYDDLSGIGEVTSLPDNAPHRNVDKVILESTKPGGANFRTAIVCPATIYGEGSGPGNKRSIQLPELARISVRDGQAFQVGKGKTIWGNIHISDLAQIFLKLVEAAAAGSEDNDMWNDKGYYFAASSEHVWGDISKKIAEKAVSQRLIKSTYVRSVTAAEATKFSSTGGILWGANSRCKAGRAQAKLSWSPNGPSLESTISNVVACEGSRPQVR